MSLQKIKSTTIRHLINIPGWRTNRKIVVIESDDWGSIRMASRDALNLFIKKGLPVADCPYSRNDSLESNSDLESLFEVLSSVKDSKDNPAIMTLNAVTCNPNFEKIKSTNYSEYYYENIINTYKRYSKHDQVIALYHQGLNENIIKLQFHGREHLNVTKWMKALSSGDKYAHMAFENNMFSLHYMKNPEYKNEYMDALNYESEEEKRFIYNSLTDGLTLFEKTWGYKSKSFIAPCYIWSNEINEILYRNNVKYLQGILYQVIPNYEQKNTKTKQYNIQGNKNKYGQIYIIRNGFFEPSIDSTIDCIGDCLKRIEIAFRMNKPAVISSHRVNYIGSINKENRTKNLSLLKLLLTNIIKIWPNVEFMSTDSLGDIIENKI
jgi:hypothetical protein